MKVELSELQRWGWECPLCGNWYEESEDPEEMDEVFCEECNEEFELVVV